MTIPKSKNHQKLLSRPIVFIGVDGVLSPWGADSENHKIYDNYIDCKKFEPEWREEITSDNADKIYVNPIAIEGYRSPSGYSLWLSRDLHKAWLNELQSKSELVWFSEYGEDANSYVSPVFNLGQLRYTQNVSIDSVQHFIENEGDRPCIIINSPITQQTTAFLKNRNITIPTRIYTVAHNAGIRTKDMVEISRWIDEVCKLQDHNEGNL